MTIIFPPGYWQSTIRFESANFELGYALVILGVRGDDLMAGSAVGVAVATAVDDNILPILDSDVTFASVTTVNETESHIALSGQAGAGDGQLAPPNVALLTKKVTNVRGPRAKGRAYWPGILLDGSLDERGHMSEADQASYQTRFDAFYTDLQTAGVNLVILQNEEGISAPLNPPPVVTRLQVDRLAATQRRRMR